jgi:uncharacterized protein YbbC (DUF1343 family)
MRRWFLCLFLISLQTLFAKPKVELGIDRFFQEEYRNQIRGKRIGLITNQTGVNGQMRSTIDLFLENASDYQLVALFAPEHGLTGQAYAAENVEEKKGPKGIPVYSLHGKTRRPTDAMLKGIDFLVYDMQDIGCRCYTYTTTLFYVMEEAAKRGIGVIVLDRPNPINGITIDGPMLQEKWRSFIGYVNVPYCHGMTIGELARYFNAVYRVGCDLTVVPLIGWQRAMSFKETGLLWVPPSPHIPEPDTPLFCATTGILGELGIVNIGVGYTLPFKVVGAPWIKAEEFANKLNAQKAPGVRFLPFYYRPFFGAYKGEDCQGVMILITQPNHYRPLAVQYLIMGILKTLYSKQMNAKLDEIDQSKKNLFCKANGNDEMFGVLRTEKYVAWKLILYQKNEREAFKEERKQYLLYP